ncbi:MAG TPA: hypothetical protein VFG00_11575 [Acidothermaceae bacterium]|nr:hypothetical protein [Acidothermaceae bacterium]
MTREDELNIVRHEVEDRRITADALATTNPDVAEQLRADASLLQTLLDGQSAAG